MGRADLAGDFNPTFFGCPDKQDLLFQGYMGDVDRSFVYCHKQKCDDLCSVRMDIFVPEPSCGLFV
jgi:hypothetical protein